MLQLLRFTFDYCGVKQSQMYRQVGVFMDNIHKHIINRQRHGKLFLTFTNKSLLFCFTQKIKLGEYDFALDEIADQSGNEGFDDIPEELKETEEDRLLDEKEAEALKKFDKVLNWLWAGVGVFAAVVIIIKLVQLFL